MKLTVKNGVSVEKAKRYIEKFLQDNYADYTILKGNLNLYITLKDDENRNCPDNEKEYILEAETITDVRLNKIVEAKKKTLRDWNVYVKRNHEMMDRKIKEVNTDKNYLATAAEQGRKPENIAKREKLYHKNQKELKKITETNELLEMLDKNVKNGKTEWYVITKQKGYKKTSYDYTMEACLLFRNISGFTGYFEKSPFGCYGTLKNGLPNN